jgi:hypothetical protein
MRTWAPIVGTAIQATAALAIHLVSLIPCAPAWTAWLNVAVAAVVVVTAVGMVADTAVAGDAEMVRVAPVAHAALSTVELNRAHPPALLL